MLLLQLNDLEFRSRFQAILVLGAKLMYSFELDLHRGVKRVVYKFTFVGKNNSAVGLLIDCPLCNEITLIVLTLIVFNLSYQNISFCLKAIRILFCFSKRRTLSI